MILRSGIALLASLLIVACGAPPPGTANTGKTGWFEWAIFPVESGPDFPYQQDSYWRPDAKTVRTALKGMRGYLEHQREVELPEDEGDTFDWHDRVWGILEKLPAYKCQVIGIVEEGRRLVYLNFVHFLSFESYPDEDWTKVPHAVDDGGDHYWQAKFDPATGKFVSMYINGEA